MGNTEPMKIPITFEAPILAVKTREAAAMLSISRQTLWLEWSLGRINKLSCGTYSIEELKRYASSQPAKSVKPKIVKRKVAA